MKLWFGVKVMLIGMIIVFTGLVILIGAIKLLSLVLKKLGITDKAKAAPAAIAAAPAPVLEGESIDGTDDELSTVAVLTATILATEGSKNGKRMVVRSIRKVG